MKFKCMVLIIILMMFGAFAHADEASHRAVTEELLLLTKVDYSIKAVWQQVESMMERQFTQMGGTDTLRPIFNKHLERMRQVYNDIFAWDKIKNNFIDIYTKHYTEDEIKEILKFFKSPVGKKYAEQMPELARESMIITQKIVPDFAQKMQTIAQEMMSEMQQQEQPQVQVQPNE